MEEQFTDGFVLFDRLPEHLEEIYLNQILRSQKTAFEKSFSAMKDEREIEAYARDGKQMLRNLFTLKNIKVLTLFRGGEAVGFMTAVVREQDVSLYGLQTIEFGEGIATTIIDHAKVAFQKKRLYGLVKKDNWKAVKFFEKIGCEVLEKIDDEEKCVHPEDHPEFPYEKGFRTISYPKAGSLEDEQLKITELISKQVCTEIFPDYGTSSRASFSPQFAVALKNSFWDKGQELTVSLIGLNKNRILDIRKTKIQKALAKSWEACCAIRFKFLDHNNPTALIRISFDPNQGSWSYVGKPTTDELAGQPTMNLGWIDKFKDDDDGTIQHEFGHALGLAHEHQSPLSTIQWTDNIYYYYKYNHHWDHEKVDSQIKRRLPKDQVEITNNEYDPNSIMHYDFAAVVAGKDYKRITQLSENDKKFARDNYGDVSDISVHFAPTDTAQANSHLSIYDMFAALMNKVDTFGGKVENIDSKVEVIKSQVGTIGVIVDNIGNRVETLEKKGN